MTYNWTEKETIWVKYTNLGIFHLLSLQLFNKIPNTDNKDGHK